MAKKILQFPICIIETIAIKKTLNAEKINIVRLYEKKL
jgi:hypothetical protein